MQGLLWGLLGVGAGYGIAYLVASSRGAPGAVSPANPRYYTPTMGSPVPGMMPGMMPGMIGVTSGLTPGMPGTLGLPATTALPGTTPLPGTTLGLTVGAPGVNLNPTYSY